MRDRDQLLAEAWHRDAEARHRAARAVGCGRRRTGTATGSRPLGGRFALREGMVCQNVGDEKVRNGFSLNTCSLKLGIPKDRQKSRPETRRRGYAESRMVRPQDGPHRRQKHAGDTLGHHETYRTCCGGCGGNNVFEEFSTRTAEVCTSAVSLQHTATALIIQHLLLQQPTATHCYTLQQDWKQHEKRDGEWSKRYGSQSLMARSSNYGSETGFDGMMGTLQRRVWRALLVRSPLSTTQLLPLVFPRVRTYRGWHWNSTRRAARAGSGLPSSSCLADPISWRRISDLHAARLQQDE